MSITADYAITPNRTPMRLLPQNRLLASLPREDYERVVSNLHRVPTRLKQVLQKQDEPISEVFFPDEGAVSLVKTLNDGQVTEVATTGAEGMIGSGLVYGQRIAHCHAIVQLPTVLAAMNINAFMLEMENKGAFYSIVTRYHQTFMQQLMQMVACNALHSAEQRCSRWLLAMADHAKSNDFALTHESVALMLGVRRPTVTLVIASLQQAGLIEHRRGAVRIIDRVRLERAACECYQIVTNSMRRPMSEVSTSAVRVI